MKSLGCILIGYLLGSLNPAALLGSVKKTDLRKVGTHNLGASNVLLVLGKSCGAVVMLFDICKSYFSARLARLLFPQLALAGLLASAGAVIGHIFPFYLKFQGGKGLAAFGGMVLACDVKTFFWILVLSLAMMLIVNHSYAMPMTGATLFAIWAIFNSGNPAAALLCIAVSLLIIIKHWSNIEKAYNGGEKKIRNFIKEDLFS